VALGLLGLVLEPEAALPDVLPELAPPLAWSFFESDGLDIEPEGEDGEVLEPAEEEGEPDGDLVPPGTAERSPPRSHAVTSAVPRATETASARCVSLMGPPWLGVRRYRAARNGPTCRRS
jgi:hypothetical protein